MPARPKRRKKHFKKGFVPVLWSTLIATSIVLLGLLAFYVYYLDGVVREKFEGRRWAVPAKVYARPVELYPGLPISAEQLEQELHVAGYRKCLEADNCVPGGYLRNPRGFLVITRQFDHGDGSELSRRLSVNFSGGIISKVDDLKSGRTLDVVRLDPALIGSINPRRHEDRLLLKREDLPDSLILTLYAVEDRNFPQHFGIDPKGILRAGWANLRAGKTVQGGSTLTQQLAKNFFLSSERTLWRKFNEAVMALLLEWHYDKNEILTAYANEIYLGQDGDRAIHGFGLASQFYFHRELEFLDPEQIALLVGMVRGPSYYDPRRHPERSTDRRQRVLEIMKEEGIIDSTGFQKAAAKPLLDTEKNRHGFNRFPAFLDLVRRQLRRDYKEEDLAAEGLKIFTTLSPLVQVEAEKALTGTLAKLESQRSRKGIEGSVVVTDRNTGEVLGLVGGRESRFGAFNRALDAKRPIGSLVKPAVYLAALEKGYTLASVVDDSRLSMRNPDGSSWEPKNFDRQEHGAVPLFQSLAYSYNLATVKLGMAIGIENVVEVLERLGAPQSVPPYPSVLLGAVPMTPIEVCQMYQTLTTDGFYTPLRAIRRVLDSENRILTKFPLSVEQRFDSTDIFLVNTALKEVVNQGTAASLTRYMPSGVELAGKTGTSDDLRDSWFAGFGGDLLAVVWLGKDDNSPAGLTGASGALVVWGTMMRALGIQPLRLAEPAGIEWARVSGAGGEVLLPFRRGTAPVVSWRPKADNGRPGEAPLPGRKNVFRRLMDLIF